MEPARSGEGLELGRLGSGHASTRLDEESALLSGQPEDDYLGEDEDNNDADAAGKGPGHGHSAFFDPDTIDEEAAALAAKRAAKRRGGCSMRVMHARASPCTCVPTCSLCWCSMSPVPCHAAGTMRVSYSHP